MSERNKPTCERCQGPLPSHKTNVHRYCRKCKRAVARERRERSCLHVEDVPEQLRKDFKVACVRANTNMRNAIKDFMNHFIIQHAEK